MKKKRTIPVLILMASPIIMIMVTLLSIIYGAKEISLTTVEQAFFAFDAENVDHQIIWHSRMPRAIGSLLIGGFLAISGAMMQGVTRNYLASPSIMAVTDGSVFAITLAMIFIPQTSSLQMIGYSLVGSALSVLLVIGLASRLLNGFSPVQLAIIGTVVGTFLSSVSAGLATYFHISQDISFWYNARLHQLDPALMKWAILFGVIGIGLALVLSSGITILSLGEEVAIGLGQKTAYIKWLAMLAVIILTGISAALVGHIAFIGLIIPHLTRFLVGSNYRWIIPCAGVIGAIFLTLSDLLSRFINYPFETPISVVTSLIGVPFFLYLIRTRGGKASV
ncbi:FecCD family ABC transporter permease [Amphibacillus cookii]|uniref:FecCD family ABC transporter permease n=1 Tax=Amphibacillus cookii TaxID=767787 RepID=UPI00195D9015|nr:iron ABC transporter permease [Amphibacillus cookii]MBM7542346.1 iron complex transport system permease protein [Amphibacillus cookii]